MGWFELQSRYRHMYARMQRRAQEEKSKQFFERAHAQRTG